MKLIEELLIYKTRLIVLSIDLREKTNMREEIEELDRKIKD